MLVGDRAINRKDAEVIFWQYCVHASKKNERGSQRRKVTEEGTKIYISPHGEEVVS